MLLKPETGEPNFLQIADYISGAARRSSQTYNSRGSSGNEQLT